MQGKTFKQILMVITYAAFISVVFFRTADVISLVRGFFAIIRPIIIGGGIAFVLSKPVNFFKKLFLQLLPQKYYKTANIFSILIVYIIFILFVSALFRLVIPSLVQSISAFAQNARIYSENLQDLVASLPVILRINLQSIEFERIVTEFQNILQTAATGIFPQVFSFTLSLSSAIISIFLGFILSIYFLSEKEHLAVQTTRLINAYAPKALGRKIFKLAGVSNYVFSKYVMGQLTEAFILGSLCYIFMTIIGFEYAVLISVVIGVTNIIPFIGPIIGAIPSAFILLMVQPMQAVWFLVFIIILQQIESNFIYPRVVGGSVGLSAPYVLSAVLIGGGLFGAFGMLFTLPTLSVIYQLIKINLEDKETNLNT